MCDFYELGTVFVGSLLRSDVMSSKSHECVPMNCSDCPKRYMFNKAYVMQFIECL